MLQKTFRVMLPLFFVFLAGCEDYIENSNVPETDVSITINLSNVEWLNGGLLSDYNAVIYNDICTHCAKQGYENLGIIIVKLSNDEFYAFDRCCTVDPVEDPHALNVNGIYATCPKDGSKFILGEGYTEIASGPAKYPLRTYKTSRSGNILRIYD